MVTLLINYFTSIMAKRFQSYKKEEKKIEIKAVVYATT